MSLGLAKNSIREQVWTLLDSLGVSDPVGAFGRIPRFAGSSAAARRLGETKEWRRASVVKANPDTAQMAVRAMALADGKLLYMAAPYLAAPQPFVLLDPQEMGPTAVECADAAVALQRGRPVDVVDMQPIDISVCGSVAVTRSGARLGKGGGYFDLETAVLAEEGLLGERTWFITTVDGLQIYAGKIPMADHDVRLDVIATPDELIRCDDVAFQPKGVDPDMLLLREISSMPFLAERLGTEAADDP